MEDLLSGQDDETYAIQERAVSENPGAGPQGKGFQREIDFTLEARNTVQAVTALSVAIRGRDGGGTAELGDDLAGALRASQGGSDKPHVLAFGGNNTTGPIDVATAVRAKGGTGHGDFESETFLVQESFAFKASHFTRGKDGATAAGAPSLSADADKGDQDTLVLAFDTTQITSPGNFSSPKPGDPCHPLAAQQHLPAIADNLIVRRLMPVETERLQGFPDGHTAVHFRGKPMADGPRYRAIGNSMSVPVMAWIGRRIERALISNHGGIRNDNER